MSTITKPSGKVSFSAEEFARMQDAGLFEGRHVELLGGELYEVTKNPPHNVAVTLTAKAIRVLLPERSERERQQEKGFHVREEKTIESWSDADGRGWWTEPDLAVLRGSERDYKDHHPQVSDIVLLCEVTDTSPQDRTLKLAGYAEAGFPQYWILDLELRQLEVYSDLAGGQYPASKILGETDSVDLVIDGQVVGQIAVADLLP